MIVPTNLHQIQPRTTQLWRCDDTGFDPNGKWNKAVRNYKLFQREIMWKVKNIGSAPLWYTIILFSRADVKCLMPPIVSQKAKDYFQDIHHNIPLYFKVHHTPSGYMDRDGWIKAMTQLLNRLSASHVNNQILFFGGHVIHFENLTLPQMQRENIQPFILKAVGSINNQYNDNGRN